MTWLLHSLSIFCLVLESGCGGSSVRGEAQTSLHITQCFLKQGAPPCEQNRAPHLPKPPRSSATSRRGAEVVEAQLSVQTMTTTCNTDVALRCQQWLGHQLVRRGAEPVRVMTVAKCQKWPQPTHGEFYKHFITEHMGLSQLILSLQFKRNITIPSNFPHR